MSQKGLAPFSTFRTNKRNILAFRPKYFDQQLYVKFPDSRLAACPACKKNFKTKEICRVRNLHTSAPWSTAYICVTIDESCLNEEGKIDDNKTFTMRMVQWQPFAAQKPFHPKTTPVCSLCKKTNRTKTYCRGKQQHRQLPYSTIYVLMTPTDETDPHTVVVPPSRKVGIPISESHEAHHPVEGSKYVSGDVTDDTEDLRRIPDLTRTFLAKVSTAGVAIHWLDLEAEPPSDAANFFATSMFCLQRHDVPPLAGTFFPHVEQRSLSGPPPRPLMPGPPPPLPPHAPSPPPVPPYVKEIQASPSYVGPMSYLRRQASHPPEPPQVTRAHHYPPHYWPHDGVIPPWYLTPGHTTFYGQSSHHLGHGCLPPPPPPRDEEDEDNESTVSEATLPIIAKKPRHS